MKRHLIVEYNEKGKIVNKDDLKLVLLGKKNHACDVAGFSKDVEFSYFITEEMQTDGSILIYGKKKKIPFCPMCNRSMES